MINGPKLKDLGKVAVIAGLAVIAGNYILDKLSATTADKANHVISQNAPPPPEKVGSVAGTKKEINPDGDEFKSAGQVNAEIASLMPEVLENDEIIKAVDRLEKDLKEKLKKGIEKNFLGLVSVIIHAHTFSSKQDVEEARKVLMNIVLPDKVIKEYFLCFSYNNNVFKVHGNFIEIGIKDMTVNGLNEVFGDMPYKTTSRPLSVIGHELSILERDLGKMTGIKVELGNPFFSSKHDVEKARQVLMGISLPHNFPSNYSLWFSNSEYSYVNGKQIVIGFKNMTTDQVNSAIQAFTPKLIENESIIMFADILQNDLKEKIGISVKIDSGTFDSKQDVERARQVLIGVRVPANFPRDFILNFSNDSKESSVSGNEVKIGLKNKTTDMLNEELAFIVLSFNKKAA